MQSLKKIEKQIEQLKEHLAQIGNMRPGTLSVQYRKPADRKHPFHQISYTHKGKSRSEYVRTENIEVIRKEIAAYNHFKEIHQQLVELSIEASRIRCRTKITPRSSSSKRSHQKKCT